MGREVVWRLKSWSSILSKQAINWQINSRDQLIIREKKVLWDSVRLFLPRFSRDWVDWCAGTPRRERERLSCAQVCAEGVPTHPRVPGCAALCAHRRVSPPP